MTQDTDSDYFSDGSRTVSITTQGTSQSLADADRVIRIIRIFLLTGMLSCVIWIIIWIIQRRRLDYDIQSDTFRNAFCESQCVCKNLTR